MTSYCEKSKDHAIHGPYHDNEYGFPTANDNVLFEKLSLEIMQAGLSWLTVLKKRDALRMAFAGFDIKTVATFDSSDVSTLMNNTEIIRNRRKVLSIIENAKRILLLKKSHNSFHSWLNSNHPKKKDDWTTLFRSTFQFTGGQITIEFLNSSGYLPYAHSRNCAVFKKILSCRPPWSNAKLSFYDNP